MVIGLLLIVAALFYAGRNLYHRYEAESNSTTVLKTYKEVVEPKPQMGSTPDYILFPDMAMPEVEIDGNRYIGTIEIPDLGVELPVMTDWSYPKLQVSPCRYMGSIYANDAILMSHDYRGHFGLIYTLGANAKTYFVDVKGNRFEYELMDLEQLYPTDVDILEKDGDWDLTLFACIYDGRMRTVARFKKVADYPYVDETTQE